MSLSDPEAGQQQSRIGRAVRRRPRVSLGAIVVIAAALAVVAVFWPTVAGGIALFTALIAAFTQLVDLVRR